MASMSPFGEMLLVGGNHRLRDLVERHALDQAVHMLS
jgi:hypothetical protein